MNIPFYGFAVMCTDHPVVQTLVGKLEDRRILTYGENPQADVRLTDLDHHDGQSRFSVSFRDREGATVHEIKNLALPMPGRHNALNATAALILAEYAGAPAAACASACASFKGASRRFEILGTAAGITVVDDYAHHPTEVTATLDAARQRFRSGRILAVYVPHTYSRTLTLLHDYLDAFRGADLLLLGPIEPARERHLAHTVSTADVAGIVHGVDDVRVVAGSDEALAILLAEARPGDAVVCMSVRGFDDLSKRTLRALRERDGR
jgi:UDP-N-acetylmuramate--alanine ligase